MMQKLDACGDSDFIPLFDKRFGGIDSMLARIDKATLTEAQKVLFIDLPADIEPLPVTPE